MSPLGTMPKIGYREKDAAAFVGVSASTFRAWVEQGIMPKARKIGGCKIYRADEIVDHFDRLTAQSGPIADEWADVLGQNRA